MSDGRREARFLSYLSLLIVSILVMFSPVPALDEVNLDRFILAGLFFVLGNQAWIMGELAEGNK